jgi:hypothetical protein
VPVRQWVLAPPFPLVPLLGARPEVLSAMNRIFVSTVSRWVESQVPSRGRGPARTGAVTFIQRFSRSLLLFPHLHVVVLDGAYVEDTDGVLQFEATRTPTESDVAFVSRAVAHRLGRYLRQHGFIDADDLETLSSPLMRWYAGLLREPAGYSDVDEAGGVEERRSRARRRSTGEAQRFSVHAEVTVAAHDAAGRARLCRYASRPPLADAQLSMTLDGRVAVQLRGRRRSGAGHVVLEPVRLLRRLAWLIPPPGSPQVRFAGVLSGTRHGGRGWCRCLRPGRPSRTRPRLRRAPRHRRARATRRRSRGTCCCAGPTTWMRRCAAAAVTGCGSSP